MSVASDSVGRYQVGGSLRIDDPHYVVRRADEELLAALKAGEFCYVLNSRQMGKSSLRVRTRHRLESEGCRCASIDLTSIGSHNVSPLQWYKGIASELWRGFNLTARIKLKDWWAQLDDLPPVQRLQRFLEDVVLPEVPGERITIFIDEIDSVLSLPFSSDDFFALIRFCFNQRAEDPAFERLTFALFGVATPGNLIRDTQRTPFNIGRAIMLEGFQEREVGPLARGLQGYVRDPTAVLQAVLYWTKGQPFLTQKLCQIIKQVGLERPEAAQIVPSGDERSWVGQLAWTYIIEDWEARDEPEHLRTIRDRLLRNETLAEPLLELYQRLLEAGEVPYDRSPVQGELLLSGLTCNIRNRTIVRNRIYQAVFDGKWVRQRLAELRPYTAALESWRASGYQDDSRLLRGQALQEAQDWAQNKDLGPLDYQFLTASVLCDRRETELVLKAKYLREVEARLAQEKRTARRQRWLLGAASLGFMATTVLGLVAFREYLQVLASERAILLGEVETHIESTRALLEAGQGLDALVQSIQATQRLREIEDVPSDLVAKADRSLRQSFFRIAEANRLQGHTSDALAVTLDPRQGLIATSGRDSTIRLWRQDGTFLRAILSGERGSYSDGIADLAFSPDGEVLASASRDGTIKFWTTDGELLRTLTGHKGAIFDIDFSPDGTWLASAATNGTVKLWNRADGTLRETLTGHPRGIQELAISPDGQFIATGGRDQQVRLWQLVSDRYRLVRTYPQRGATIRGLDFSSDGTVLAVGGDDRQIRLWHRDGTRLRTLIGHVGPVQELAFTRDGRRLVTASWDGTLKIWNWSAGDLLQTLTGHTDRIWDLELSADGETLASASWDNTVRLWQFRHPALVRFQNHTAPIIDVAASPDGRTIATASDDFAVQLWQPDGRPDIRLEGHGKEVYSVAFSPDGELLASGGRESAIVFHSRDGGTPQQVIAEAHAEQPIWSLDFSPDGQWLVSGGNDGTVKLWRRDGTPVSSFLGRHDSLLREVAFDPRGRTIASASLDGTAKLWSLRGGLLTVFTGHEAGVNGLAFSPDGRVLATASDDRTIKLWRRNGELLRTLSGHDGEVSDVAFSPDGRLLASAGWDDTVRLWRRDGTPLAVLNGHGERVWRLTFSPDGRTLFSGGDDKTLIGWDLERVVSQDRVLAESCAWAQDFLSANPQADRPSVETDLCKVDGDPDSR